MYVLSALKWLKVDLEFNCKVELSEEKIQRFNVDEGGKLERNDLEWRKMHCINSKMHCVVHVRLYVMHIKEDSFHEME